MAKTLEDQNKIKTKRQVTGAGIEGELDDCHRPGTLEPRKREQMIGSPSVRKVVCKIRRKSLFCRNQPVLCGSQPAEREIQL